MSGHGIFDFSGKPIESIPKISLDVKEDDLISVIVTGCKKLTSLKGLPHTIRTLRARDCTSLTSLVGGPTKVRENVFLQGSAIKSLEGLLEVGGGVNINDCLNIRTLSGIGLKYLKFCHSLYLPYSIKSHILGLIFIKNLRTLKVIPQGTNKELEQAITIMQEHFASNESKDKHDSELVIETQHKLIEAGLEDYAEL